MMLDGISAWRVQLPVDAKYFVLDSIDKQCLSMGRFVEELELRLSELLGYKYVICMANGSICQLALLIALLPAERSKPVFIPNRTWVCTPNALEILHYPYRLFDCEPCSPVLMIDESFLQAIESHRPSAIIVSYINGISPENIDDLYDCAATYGIPVLIDRCQSLTNLHHGHELASFYSMGITKLLGIGQGGFIGTNDPILAAKLKLIRTHGAFDPYWRTPIDTVGFNFRLTDLHAVIGLSVIPFLEERIKRISDIQQIYFNRLAPLKPQFLPVYSRDYSSPSIYNEFLASRRDELIAYLNGYGIQARPLFPSIHAMYPSMTIHSSQSNSNRFDTQGLSLPGGPDQSHQDINLVCDKVMEFYASVQ